MAVTLWTVHFIRICIANLLLFVSLYVLFPVLSVEMADRLGVPVAQTGVTVSYTHLDVYKRQDVRCIQRFPVLQKVVSLAG